MQLSRIRNFCIIAHIDHGKSTLADRFLEITGTIERRRMRDQLLDQMDIERERGITVKLAPVRMEWQGHELNLIDTPGHVDFTYEVSRSLAAVEGAILLVDVTQGIQAQTLANLDLAKSLNLVIIPVLNKIDVAVEQTEQIAKEVAALVGTSPDRIIRASGKTGQGVTEILERIIHDIPAPRGNPAATARALIFDSIYDGFQGVIAYVRVVDGVFAANAKISLLGTHAEAHAIEVGRFRPWREKTAALAAGEIGYIVTNLKNVNEARVGDTLACSRDAEILPGYRELQPMVYAGIFSAGGDQATDLREALQKLRLNDAALRIEPEQSAVLGPGFRCGFLGLLHVDIVRERLEREFHVETIVTVPSVAYRVFKKHQPGSIEIRGPDQLPDPSSIDHIEEPYMALTVVTPATYVGPIMTMTQERHGELTNIEYLDERTAVIHFKIPLASLLVDYYDTLKSATAGYASINYQPLEYRPADVVRLDIIVAGDRVEALSSIVYREDAARQGRHAAERLKEILPRQMFEVKIQAAIGSTIVASERIPAMRKDVTAKLYGGDVTRKRKLLEKQKKGKKRMRAIGTVEIPSNAYLSLLSRPR